VRLILVLALVQGCGGSDGPVQVRGTVRYRGQPLPNALVTFMPETPEALPASGLTDVEGHYQLGTRSVRDGVHVGKHRVTITARGPDRESADGPSGLFAGNRE